MPPTPLSAALKKVLRPLSAARLDHEQQRARIESMERNIGLPVRAGVILFVTYYLFFSKWLTEIGTMSDVVLDLVRSLLVGYVVINLGTSMALIYMSRFGWWLTRWVVFTVSLLDGFFLAAVTLVAGGYDSGLYWLFFGLVIRNAVSVPVAALQIVLNLSVCAAYCVMAFVDARVVQPDLVAATAMTNAGPPVPVAEAFLLRLVLLLLMSICCYGIQVLFDRNLRIEQESREFQLRQEQLHAAGRLAGEIAHQLKNPLSIINNAAFNVQKALPSLPAKVARQIEIIRDEVDRSDRIISQVMNYAQLAEGRIERVDLAEVMNEALRQVFPPGLPTSVRVETDCEPKLPRLLGQRTQFAQIFINLLINAKESVAGEGFVRIRLVTLPAGPLVVTVEDSGCGIAPENLNRVFEAYFTTKQSGSGLGLAIVKHNVELCGGSVRAESALGKGSRFILEFPTTNLSKPAA